MSSLVVIRKVLMNLFPLFCFPVIVSVLISLQCCSKKNDPAPNTATSHTPTVVIPDKGRPGSLVTIIRDGFDNIMEKNIVTFNGVKATIKSHRISSSEKDELVVYVPFGATTGNISLKVGSISAEGPEFVVIGPHIIESISPEGGSENATLSIKGKFFSTTPAENEVYIHDKHAAVITASEDELKVSVPKDASSGKISISILGLKVEGPTFTAAPVIYEVEPLTGFPLITEVTIKGNNFMKDRTIVKIDNNEAHITSITKDQIKVIVPRGANDGKITVSVDRFSAISSADFDVQESPGPVIISILPLSGLPGEEITIMGENFALHPDDNIITFNGTKAIVKEVKTEPRTLIAIVPEMGTNGPIKIVIHNKEVESKQNFYFLNTPVITDFNPKEGTQGTLVTITGRNFSEDKTKIVVKLGEDIIPVESSSNNQLIVRMPKEPLTAIDKLTITVDGIRTVGSRAVFYKRLLPKYLHPATLSAKPGDAIKIIGDFSSTKKENVEVVFQGKNDTFLKAEIINVESAQIEVIVPAKAITGKIGLSLYKGDFTYTKVDFIIDP
jgi:hypothetical protein